MNYDDIFDKLNESLGYSMRQMKKLQDQLKLQIQRRIINDMMNAKTIAELDEIRAVEDIWFKEWGELLTHYQNALKRLELINLTRIKNWPTFEMN